MPNEIDVYSLSAKHIQLSDGTYASEATGFIWAESDQLYLITNWHNVSGLNPITGQPLNHNNPMKPGRVTIQMDLIDPKGSRGPVDLNLYDKNGQPIWFEHPMRKDVDVVAIPLPSMPVVHPHPINLMPKSPMVVGIGADAFIVGYPFGLSVGPFPIWKRASIASELNVPVNGKPFFYVDTASRPGMSGSPVIARAWGLYQTTGGNQVGSPGAHNLFLGVYSGRIVGENEYEAQLGRVWHAGVIDVILKHKRVGSPIS